MVFKLIAFYYKNNTISGLRTGKINLNNGHLKIAIYYMVLLKATKT